MVVVNSSNILLAAVCLGGALVYVFASWKAFRPAAVAAKVAASTSFVAISLINGAATTPYGRAVLAALIFSWLGDVLLLSRESVFFLAGMAAFFAAHVAFSAAFALKPVSITALAAGLAVTGLFGAVILRWLWPFLRGPYRFAVPLYLAAIMIMVSLAVAASASALPPIVAIGAIAFALSDVSVARDRFIERDVVNKAWGLPLYYFAQVIFAISVAGSR